MTTMTANTGEPCRFCRRPFGMTKAHTDALRDLGLYDEQTTDQEIADDCDICPVCAEALVG